MSNSSGFSNQKAALEEYFNSLLHDLDDDTPLIEEQPDTGSVTVSSATAEKTEEVVVEAAYAQFEKEVKQEVRSKSVEEILAPVAEAADDSTSDAHEVEAQPEAEREAKTVKEFAEPVSKIKMPMPTVAPAVEEPVTDVPVEVPVAEVKQAEPEVVEPVEIEQQQAEKYVVEEGIPEWAESPFQCLLFKVGGLALAVPLIKLNGVIPWSDKISVTPNQTDWYLGILQHLEHKVRIIDTALMVIPNDHADVMPDEADRLSHILLVDNQRWGLACESIGEVVWLKQDDVKWRTNKGKRPWLMGTSIEHMCALMDTEAFAQMLNENETR